jgi:hypothetical protein
MNLTEAIKILKTHNEWRRGAEIEMTDPATLGKAIDIVLEAVSTLSDVEEAVRELQAIWQANSSEAKREFIGKIIERNAKMHGGVYDILLNILNNKEHVHSMEKTFDNYENMKKQIKQFLNDNRHLADGENCTFRELKKLVPDWE